MTVKYKEGLIESCVLIAEANGNRQRFNIAKPYIAEAVKVIKTTFDYIGSPCDRVYISGFNLVSKNETLTKEGIVERIALQQGVESTKTENVPFTF